MRLTLLCSMLWCALGSSPVTATTNETSTTQSVLIREWVPNRVVPQGEVRLVQQGASIIVQTALFTRFEKRVASRIASKEQANWGTDEDAARYLEALEEAIQHYGKTKKSAKHPLALVIDFIDGLNFSGVTFSVASVSRDRKGLHLESGETFRSLNLSPTYIEKNQEHIMADAFQDRASDGLSQLAVLRATQGGGPHE